MTPRATRDEQTRWLRVKEVFSEASEAEPEERDSIVDTRCGADKEMADEVRSLLRLGEEDGLSLDRATPFGITLLETGPPPRHNCGEVLAGRWPAGTGSSCFCARAEWVRSTQPWIWKAARASR